MDAIRPDITTTKPDPTEKEPLVDGTHPAGPPPNPDPNLDTTIPHQEKPTVPKLETSRLNDKAHFDELSNAIKKNSYDQLSALHGEVANEIKKRGFFHNARMSWLPFQGDYRTRQTKLDSLNDSLTIKKNLKKFISTEGADKAIEGHFPRGSAFMTSSGNLQNHGIHAIIHAAPATGMVGENRSELQPTLDSVTNSVRNAVRLARENGLDSLAIPMIGGGIFAKKIFQGEGQAEGKDANGNDIMTDKGALRDDLAKQLAKAIHAAATEANTGDPPIDLQFIGKHFEGMSGASSEENILKTKAADGKRHGIMNAGNTDGKFGEGLAGAIGKATGKKSDIDAEAQRIKSLVT